MKVDFAVNIPGGNLKKAGGQYNLYLKGKELTGGRFIETDNVRTNKSGMALCTYDSDYLLKGLPAHPSGLVVLSVGFG